MNSELKKLALSQYFKNFRVGIILLVLALAGFVFALSKSAGKTEVEENTACPTERVYDAAEVLSAEEEDSLRELIATYEQKYQIHIVLVTTNWDVPYGQEYVARDAADDFYDENNYGYDKIHGDGCLILDCISETPGMSYVWLSTCGKVEDKFSSADIDEALEAMNSSTYSAYKATIQSVVRIYAGGFFGSVWSYILIVLVGLISGLIYKAANKSQAPAPVTTTKNTYTAGEPVVVRTRDDFLRKNVTTERIESSSSGSRSGGGHHVSSGGVSHGGGGRRH